MSIEPGTYTIQQKASDLYLDCAQKSDRLHLSVQHGTDNPYQKWIVGRTKVAGCNDELFIIMQDATKRVLGANPPDLGTEIKVTRGDVDNTYQRWRIEREGDAWTIIQHSEYGNYVDCQEDESKTGADVYPHLAQHNMGNPYQLWYFTAVKP